MLKWLALMIVCGYTWADESILGDRLLLIIRGQPVTQSEVEGYLYTKRAYEMPNDFAKFRINQSQWKKLLKEFISDKNNFIEWQRRSPELLPVDPKVLLDIEAKMSSPAFISEYRRLALDSVQVSEYVKQLVKLEEFVKRQASSDSLSSNEVVSHVEDYQIYKVIDLRLLFGSKDS